MNFTEILYIRSNSKNNINFDSKALIMVMAEILTIATYWIRQWTINLCTFSIIRNKTNSSADQKRSSYNFGGLSAS